MLAAVSPLRTRWVDAWEWEGAALITPERDASANVRSVFRIGALGLGKQVNLLPVMGGANSEVIALGTGQSTPPNYKAAIENYF